MSTSFNGKLKALTFIFPLALITTLLIGCGESVDGERSYDRLLLQGSTSGGIGYSYLNGIVEISSNELPDINMTLEATTGYTENAQRMSQGVGDIGIIAASDAFDIYQKSEEYSDSKENILTMLPVHTLDWHVAVKKESEIDSISDLEGKVVNLQPFGSFNQGLSERIFDALEIEFTAQNLEHSDAADAMQTDSIDAHVMSGSSTAFQELSLRTDLKILTLSDEDIKKITSELPFLTSSKFDAEKYYKGTGEVNIVSVWAIIGVNEAVPDDIVYNMTKSVYENIDTLKNYHSSAENMDPNQILEVNIPLHPGALRYFEEKGIEIPDELKP